jgi:uncharacterized coiled-coil DUF342 family protein
MGKSLEAAKKHHAKIQEHATGKNFQAHHEAISKHHAKAMEHHQLLKKEMEKAKPDFETIKKHAAGVHQEIGKAEGKHKELKAKRGVKEPKEPTEK